jgi:TetR/AcrR family transcriptional regulator, mexJK operon transcriptional repressor
VATPTASRQDEPGARPPTRSERKHQAILEAARVEFLRNGYAGTSMDAIAAAAPVSKQTVYKHFSDKDSLFRDLVIDTMKRVEQRIQAVSRIRGPGDDLERELIDLAQGLVDSILDPEVLAVRRLIVAESHRFPALGRIYYERGFKLGLQSLAARFGELAEQGRLAIDDTAAAADHFAGMVLWHPANQAMFCGPDHAPTKQRAHGYAQSGARAFLAAYVPRG